MYKKILGIVVLIALGANAALARDVSVKGYYRKDGTYVSPHMRTSPNSTSLDNYSTKGNVNPYTGAAGTKDPYLIGYPSSSVRTGSGASRYRSYMPSNSGFGGITYGPGTMFIENAECSLKIREIQAAARGKELLVVGKSCMMSIKSQSVR